MASDAVNGIPKLVVELRRRGVFRGAGLYIVAAWLVLQVADLAFESWGVPDHALRYVWVGTFLLFPLFIVFVWFYELTAHGLTRTPPHDPTETVDLSLKRTDYVILTALGVVAAIIAVQIVTQIRETDRSASALTIATESDRYSVAVLPLDNLSDDSEQEYFADGMTDALILDLSKISGLKVISRTSVMRFKGTDQPLPQIARELGVATIVEGTVLRAGDRVRITAQLIDARSDAHLWADSYERDLANVLLLQSEVAQDIAKQIEVTLTPDEKSRLGAAHQVVPASYEAYLKGRFHTHQYSPQDLDLAMRHFDRALQIDPENALAYDGVATAWLFRWLMGAPPEETHPQWKAATMKALQLDDMLPEAHAQLASILFSYDWEWAKADAEYIRSFELNPNNAEAHALYGHLLTVLDRADEARFHMDRALELDPLNSFIQMLYGEQLSLVGRYDDSIRYFHEIVATAPMAYFVYWRVLGFQEMYEQAFEQARTAFSNFGDADVVDAMDQGYARSGYAEAMKQAAEVLEARSQTDYVKPMYVAYLYDDAGMTDPAIQWLEKAFQARDLEVAYLSVLLLSEELRERPEFQTMLEGLDYPASNRPGQ